MIIAWKNQIDNYSLTADAYSDTFAIDNIKDARLTNYWKGTDSDAVQNIVIDCGAAVEPGIFVILGHNFGSFSAPVVKIMGNTTNDFSSPAYSHTFTSIADIMFHLYTGSAYQYFCIQISGCTATDIPIIGHVFMDDDSFLFGAGFKLSKVHPIEYIDNSVSAKSITGELFGYKNDESAILRSYKLVYDFLTGANFVLYRAFMNYVQKALPYVIIWDETLEYPGMENIYCHNVTGLSAPETFGFSGYSVSHEIEECR